MKWLFALALAGTLYAEPPQHLLYLVKNQQTNSAITQYRKYMQESGEPDFDFLHELAWSLIAEGCAHEDVEVNLLALFGASLSTQDKALPFFIKGFHSKNPNVQAAALNFLAKMNLDQADKELLSGLSSNQVLIRFMTLHLMAEKKMQGASMQAEALLAKLPKELHPLFPPIFAQIGDDLSMKQIRRFLSDPDDRTRASAILSILATEHEEYLPQVRRAAKQVSPILQETAAACLGAFHDDKSRDILKKLAKSQNREVKTTAMKALYQLDDESAKEMLFEEAKGGNIFAFNELAIVKGYDDFLVQHLAHADKNVRINAAMALLEKKNPKCLWVIEDYLINDRSQMILTPNYTLSKACCFWKFVPCSFEAEEEETQIKVEKLLQAKEHLLAKVFELPERYYLKLAEKLFESQQNSLLPALVLLLENSGSEEAIHLLKKYQQQIGAPFVRMICTLALYRLAEKGPYKDILRSFIKEWSGTELIQFRPILSENIDRYPGYELTPTEVSRLLVESLESLVGMQDNETIDIILNAIQHGNPKNKYALAGILVRATL